METERDKKPGITSVIYKNQSGDCIYLDCITMQQGAAADFVTEGMNVSDVTIHGCPGKLFLSKSPEQSKAVTWIDSDANLQFTVDGFQDRTSILHIAESVSLEKLTK